MEEKYVSRQIAVYKTKNKLVEWSDKLKLASKEHYAHIHAHKEENEDGWRVYSRIGLMLQDHSQGNDKKQRVMANLTADEAQYIYNAARNQVQVFEFAREKIFGQVQEGTMQVTKLRIIRNTVGSDGQPRKYPWYIEVENGRGVGVKGENGSVYCKPKSYQCATRVFLNMNDEDFFACMNRVNSYIVAWELAYGPARIREGRKILEDILSSSKAHAG